MSCINFQTVSNGPTGQPPTASVPHDDDHATKDTDGEPTKKEDHGEPEPTGKNT